MLGLAQTMGCHLSPATRVAVPEESGQGIHPFPFIGMTRDRISNQMTTRAEWMPSSNFRRVAKSLAPVVELHKIAKE
jgi:hypothetical protein